ncbi:hypothetical protein PQI51_03385 [Microbacterium esteraromaticum]|uniref:hypothetical protein n=1 Tax=Microbacterium esteraromaticum TaxID=57043 RepID=UPI0030B18B0B
MPAPMDGGIMTERIDHAALALRVMEADRDSALGWEAADAQHLANLAEAQLHATLALVEQQRIANRQTERAALRARADGRSDLAAAGMEAQATILDLQIREGLGLT